MSWQPCASWAALRLRARILRELRRFFDARGILEIETPVLSRAATVDPAIDSFDTLYRGPGCSSKERLFLQTSPEFFMKRLLAAGSGPIYQLARVFRNAEAGRRHNPEFTLLEWYRPGFDHQRLMDEVEDLLNVLLPGHALLAGPIERQTYRQLFIDFVGVDPFKAAPADIRILFERCGLRAPGGMPEVDVRPWLDLAFTLLIEPRLAGRAVFVYEYPADQAALARVRLGDPPVAERFELYFSGIELANGFHELGDANEQRSRFLEENRRRESAGSPVMPMDQALLAALEAGLPDCAGVALGVDRLVMAAAGVQSIEQVLAFAWPTL